jgi:hypothetical protein
VIPWRLVVYASVVLALLAALWGYGHQRYEAGRSAERARWEPALAAAEKAAAEADARTVTLESAQKLATSAAEARHAETIDALNARAADADRRIRALSLRLASDAARRCEMPGVSGTAAESHAGAGGDERAERAGSSIADIGRRCEADAASLGQLQQWIREQAALNRQARAACPDSDRECVAPRE